MTVSDDLTCYACGASASLPAKRCECGEPLWLDSTSTGFEWPAGGLRSDLWRYEALLPVERPLGLGAGAGGTPLYRTARLDRPVGTRLWVKNEAENATGSFKDRGSAVGVAWADAAGYERVGTVSHGNMAMSMAAHAAAHGLECTVLVPADIPAERLSHIAAYDPTILRVDGPYGRLYYDALELGRDLGIAFVNSDTPLRVAGQKTVAFELLEAFSPGVPDAIVLPVSSGGHASGVWKACRELRAAGRIDRIPELYLVQAAACAPIARAFESGADHVTPVEAEETIAYSIANADPPSGTRALAAARETGGGVLAVDDGAIRSAERLLAEKAGLNVEPGCASAIAGVRELVADGSVGPDDDVVVIATGTGLKEPKTGASDHAAPTVAREGLRAALADGVGQ